MLDEARTCRKQFRNGCFVAHAANYGVDFPDYISVDASTSVPLAPALQVGVNLTYTRGGHLFVGGEGGPGVPGTGASARAGWINGWGQSSSGDIQTDILNFYAASQMDRNAYIDDFIGGGSVTASGYLPVIGMPGKAGVGPSVGEQWGNVGQYQWKDTSTEVGTAVGAGRSFQVTGSWSIGPVSFGPFTFQGPGW